MSLIYHAPQTVAVKGKLF